MDLKEEEDTLGLLYIEALKLVYGHLTKKLIRDIGTLPNACLLSTAAKRGFCEYLFNTTNKCCTIVQYIKKRKTPGIVLLYDNYYRMIRRNSKITFHGFILGLNGELIQYTNDVKDMDHLWSVPKRFKKDMWLEDILDNKSTTPQNLRKASTMDHMQQYLKHHNLERDVRIQYLKSTYPKPTLEVMFQSYVEKTKIVAFQYKGRLHFTSYDNIKDPKPVRKRDQRRLKKLQEEHTHKMESIPSSIEDLYQKNRSGATSIFAKCLSLAFYLGILSKASWRDMANELNKMVLFLWPHYDCKKELRSIFVFCPSNMASIFCKLDTMENEELDSVKQYASLFKFISQQQRYLCEQKTKLLEPLLNQLTAEAVDSTGYHLLKKCLRELKTLCMVQRIIYFQNDDLFLHNFKLPFAYYVTAENKAKQVREILDALKIPIALRSVNLDLENIRSHLFASDNGSFNLYDDAGNLTSLFGSNDTRPLPLIDADKTWDQLANSNPFCPGIIGNTFNSVRLPKYVKQRSEQLTWLLYTVYNNWSNWLLEEFNFDASHGRMTFSELSYHCIMNKFWQFGGPLIQGPEKMKPYYDYFLRSFCHGGFSFSCHGEVVKGQPLYPNTPHLRAQNVIELDLVSSYGAAASCTESVPGGFCMAYFNNNNSNPLEAYPTDKYQRWCSFEFTTTFAIIEHYQNVLGRSIKSAFHNYSPMGLFRIDNYYVDLALVFEDSNEIALFQMDGQYVHGCDVCPELPRYVGNKSWSEIRETTKQRDQTIINAIANISQICNQTITYTVVCSCHDEQFSPGQVKEMFKLNPKLAKFQEPYKWLPKDKIVLESNGFVSVPDDLTYIIVCRGYVDLSKPNNLAHVATHLLGGALPCINKEEEGKHFFENVSCQDTLMSKKWFEFAINVLGFVPTVLKAIFFYRRCDIMPQVYTNLISQRAMANTRGNMFDVQVLKRLINFSCGYFGLNQNKALFEPLMGQINHSIVNKVNKPKNYNIFRHYITPIGFYNDEEFFLKKMPKHQPKHWRPSRTHLPFFIHVIEEGKLRLYQRLILIMSFCKMGAVKLLYIHIDNMILALAEGNSIHDLVEPQLMPRFEKYFASQLNGYPGHLKLQWSLEDATQWRFISPKICTYVAQTYSTVHQGHCKFSTLTFKDYNDMSTQYQIAKRMLENETIQVCQERRVDKSINLETALIHLNM